MKQEPTEFYPIILGQDYAEYGPHVLTNTGDPSNILHARTMEEAIEQAKVRVPSIHGPWRCQRDEWNIVYVPVAFVRIEKDIEETTIIHQKAEVFLLEE